MKKELWIFTPAVDYLYRIFSVHTAETGGSAYLIRFADYEEYANWLEEMTAASEVDTAAAPSAGDRVVTLSTCNGSSATRQVVQGYLAWQSAG